MNGPPGGDDTLRDHPFFFWGLRHPPLCGGQIILSLPHTVGGRNIGWRGDMFFQFLGERAPSPPKKVFKKFFPGFFWGENLWYFWGGHFPERFKPPRGVVPPFAPKMGGETQPPREFQPLRGVFPRSLCKKGVENWAQPPHLGGWAPTFGGVYKLAPISQT